MTPQGQQQTDQTASFFWLLCLLVGTAMLFWWFERQYIVMPAFWIRSYEIDGIYFLAQYWTPIAHFLHLPSPNLRELSAIQQFIYDANPAKIDWAKFATVNAVIGKWMRFPIMVILLILAFFAYMRGSTQFQHAYSMQSLRELGQEVWPQITPVLQLDLVKEDIDTGEWAMAKLPLHFCRENNLLVMKVIAEKKIWALKKKPAYRLFALQLGPMWRGLEALPIHVKALAVIFLARATGQRPLAKQFLTQIAMSATTGKLDFSGVSDALKSFYAHRIIQWLEKRHAYITTVMATLLEIARSDGVLASSEFLWLKPIDRRMWYMMNTV